MCLTLLTSLLVGLLAPLTPQQLRVDDTVVLGKSGSGPADHATLALNSYGDLCVAFQTRTATGQRLVEAQILRRTGPGLWSVADADRLILGDPAVASYGALRDNCTKPDVVAMEDGSFVVVWPRTDLLDKQVGQLETARLEIRDLAGQFLPAPLVHSLAPGLGFILDPLIVSGDAGIMPDLVELPGFAVVAVYASEDSRTVNWNSDVWRDYTLRVVRMDWILGPLDPNFLFGPDALVAGLPMDSDAATNFAGGLVLPDIVADDDLNLVVAWEQYKKQGRHGYSGFDLGEVVVGRFAGYGAALPLSLMDEDEFSSSIAMLQQRRPTLSASRDDGANAVLVSWVDINNSPFSSIDVRFKELLYTSIAGQSQFSDRHWINFGGLDEAHPVPVQTSLHQRCFATRKYAHQRVILRSNHAAHTMHQIPCPILYPERVAAEVVETTVGGSPVSMLAITYEGANRNDADRYKVFVGIHRL